MAPRASQRAKTASKDAKDFVVDFLTQTLPAMRQKAATAQSPLFPQGISLIAVKASVGAFGEVSLLLAGTDAPEIDPFSLLKASTLESNDESQ